MLPITSSGEYPSRHRWARICAGKNNPSFICKTYHQVRQVHSLLDQLYATTGTVLWLNPKCLANDFNAAWLSACWLSHLSRVLHKKRLNPSTHLHGTALILRNNTTLWILQTLQTKLGFCRGKVGLCKHTRWNQPCMLHLYLHLCSAVSSLSQAGDEAHHTPVSKRNVAIQNTRTLH